MGGNSGGSSKRSGEAVESPAQDSKRSKSSTAEGNGKDHDDGRLSVGVLGGTGLVGRALAARLLTHPSLKLGMVIGSPTTAGKPFETVWKKKEESLVSHYGEIWKPQPFPADLAGTQVHAFEDLLAAGPYGTGTVTMVVSAIAASHGWMEEELLNAGFDVFSISPYARFDDRAQLVVPEANGCRLMRGKSPLGSGGGRLFKSPNCVSCGLSVVLEAVRQRYGLSEVAVTTFQTLTGRGDLKYDLSLVKGNVYPLRHTIEDTDEYIRKEVKQIVGGNFKLSVTAQRIFAQRGHYVDVRIKTKRPVGSVEEAAATMRDFSPFQGTGYDALPSVPTHPIRVETDAGFPRPVQAIEEVLAPSADAPGMAVTVGHLSASDEVFDLTLSFVVDNIVRGAYGAALINAELFYRACETEKQPLVPPLPAHVPEASKVPCRSGSGATSLPASPASATAAATDGSENAMLAIASAYASASEFWRKFIDNPVAKGDETDYAMLHC